MQKQILFNIISYVKYTSLSLHYCNIIFENVKFSKHVMYEVSETLTTLKFYNFFL